MTVNAAGITDLAGNSGVGSDARTWIMDTTKPPAPTQLAISPDRGLSSSDKLTNLKELTLTGAVGETNLTVRLFDTTVGADLGEASVRGTAFSKLISLAAEGSHHLRVA